MLEQSKNSSQKSNKRFNREEEISKIRPSSRGLLVIYPLKLKDNHLPLLAWCIGLPKSGGNPVEVSVNATILETQRMLEGFETV